MIKLIIIFASIYFFLFVVLYAVLDIWRELCHSWECFVLVDTSQDKSQITFHGFVLVQRERFRECNVGSVLIIRLDRDCEPKYDPAHSVVTLVPLAQFWA